MSTSFNGIPFIYNLFRHCKRNPLGNLNMFHSTPHHHHPHPCDSVTHLSGKSRGKKVVGVHLKLVILCVCVCVLNFCTLGSNGVDLVARQRRSSALEWRSLRGGGGGWGGSRGTDPVLVKIYSQELVQFRFSVFVTGKKKISLKIY